MNFSEQDRKRIAEAVEAAEAKTSGEIVPLIVNSSDRYPHADLAGGIIGQTLALIGAIWFLPFFDYPEAVTIMLTGFAAGYLLTRFIPPIKRAILGSETVNEEVYQRALQAFLELGVADTRDRTGILIMVSLLERRVHVLADKGINEKVPDGFWGGIVQNVLDGIKKGTPVEGLIEAINNCGEILAADFPPRHDDVNELKNKLVTE